jgi:hypothetical protein
MCLGLVREFWAEGARGVVMDGGRAAAVDGWYGER